MLIKSGKVTRGYLGVSIQQFDDELASALATMLREMEGISDDEALPELEIAANTVSYDELVPLEEMEMLTERLRERLEGHSIHTVQDLLAKDADGLSIIPGIGPVTAQKLLDMASQALEESLAEHAEESVVGEE